MKINNYKIIKVSKHESYTAFITKGKKPLVYIFDTIYFYDKDDKECGPEIIRDSKEFDNEGYWNNLLVKLPLSVLKGLGKK